MDEFKKLSERKSDNTIRETIWRLIRKQAHQLVTREPMLEPLVSDCVLKHSSFVETLIHQLIQKLGGSTFPAQNFKVAFHMALKYDDGSFERNAMEDLIAVEQRDPACRDILTALLYFKGFKSIQAHRLAHLLWTHNHKDLAMHIQARCTEVFGIDIHPGAKLGHGLMIDHGTGVVIGETTVVGHGCTFMHGITLGGTGTTKEFDRHPKIGNNVFLGCQVTVLGNIKIGDDSKIGSASLVLKEIKAGSIAVGSPAIVKFTDPRYTADGIRKDDQISVHDDKKGNGIEIWNSIWYPKVWIDFDPKYEEFYVNYVI